MSRVHDHVLPSLRNSLQRADQPQPPGPPHPIGTRERFFSGRTPCLSAGVARERHGFGVVVRAADFAGSGKGAPPIEASLAAYYRWTFAELGGFRADVGPSLGGGVYLGCVHGDSCGGLGATVGTELLLTRELSSWAKLVFGLDALVQFGMANGVVALVMPSLSAGLRL